MHKFKVSKNIIVNYVNRIKKNHSYIKEYNKKLIKKYYKILVINLLEFKMFIIFTKYLIKIKLKKFNIFFSISTIKGLNFNSFTKFSLKLTKKSKNTEVLKKLIEIIFLKITLFKNSPLTLHFINLNMDTNWFIDLISKKLFIINIKKFYKFSHNGCRKKKLK